MSEIVQTEIPYNIPAANVHSTPCANQYWHTTSQCGQILGKAHDAPHVHFVGRVTAVAVA